MCHRAYALKNSRIVLNGSGEELMEDEHVKETYLGI
jgi:branched-chain amino acid transport system ATP-binding protein